MAEEGSGGTPQKEALTPKTFWSIAALVVVGVLLAIKAIPAEVGIPALLTLLGVGYANRRLPVKGMTKASVLGLSVLMVGCGGRFVGPSATHSNSQVESGNFPGTTSRMADAEGNWSVTSPNGTSSISATATEANIVKGGQITRDLIFTNGETAFTLSSGSDITAKADSVVWGPFTLGGFEFTTVTSEPSRAANEALDRWVIAIDSMGEDQRAVFEAEMRAFVDSLTVISDTAKAALLKAVGL